jgi:hypothetical protein
MRFQLTSSWPAFHDLAPIPSGSILEGVRPVWFGREVPLPLPIEAAALDDAAAMLMRGWYEGGEYQWQGHRLRFGDAVTVAPRPQPRPRQQGDRMARWVLREPWPVGQFCIPENTTLEAVIDSNGEIAPNSLTWEGTVLPLPLPICATALNADAGRMLLRWYSGQRHLLHGVKIAEQVP